MNPIWKILPTELVHLILEYDGLIKLRNGKFITQLLNIESNYPLVLERMRFNKNRKFYKGVDIQTIDIHIPNTDKYIYYWITEYELRITLYTKKKHSAKILYYITN